MYRFFLLRFRRNPIQNTLLSLIVLCHLVFVLFMFFSPHFSMHKKKHKPMIVKTITPAPKTAAVINKPSAQKIATPKPQPKKESPPAPKPLPAIKKETPKPAAKSAPKEPAIADKTLSQKPQPIKKAPPPERAKISDALLKQLEESIAKIDNKSHKESTPSKPTSRQPLPSLSLQIDQAIEADEEPSRYIDALVGHLHQSLRLPDYGEVKIQLSLRQDGTVIKLAVLNAKSEKNKHYLESRLPHLKFPRFEDVYASKKEYTFTLTFCNE